MHRQSKYIMEKNNLINELIFKLVGGGVDLSLPHSKIESSLKRYWRYQYRHKPLKHTLTLSELTPENRQLSIFILRDLYGFSHYELLKIFGVSKTTLLRDLRDFRFAFTRSRKFQQLFRTLVVEINYYSKYYS